MWRRRRVKLVIDMLCLDKQKFNFRLTNILQTKMPLPSYLPSIRVLISWDNTGLGLETIEMCQTYLQKDDW